MKHFVDHVELVIVVAIVVRQLTITVVGRVVDVAGNVPLSFRAQATTECRI